MKDQSNKEIKEIKATKAELLKVRKKVIKEIIEITIKQKVPHNPIGAIVVEKRELIDKWILIKELKSLLEAEKEDSTQESLSKRLTGRPVQLRVISKADCTSSENSKGEKRKKE
jgi:cytochrome b